MDILSHSFSFLWIRGVFLRPRMATRGGVRRDEGLMMMQELDDRLKEQIDKLEHVRLAAVELKDNLSGVHLRGNTSPSIYKKRLELTVLELSSVLTWFPSNTEQQWPDPVCRWPSGMVESLVRASGDSSHEHSCFCSGRTQSFWWDLGTLHAKVGSKLSSSHFCKQPIFLHWNTNMPWVCCMSVSW